MALSRITEWEAGEILTASDLNAKIDNIIDNSVAMLSPLTGNLNLNSKLLSDGIFKHTPVTFTAQDATPDVSGGTVFKTANATATTITMFDSAVDGQTIWVIINDANTTIDFTGTNLKGNAGADWTPTTGDHLQAVFVNPYWYCRISDNTA